MGTVSPTSSNYTMASRDGFYVRANRGEAGRRNPDAMGFYQKSSEVFLYNPVWINEKGYKLYYACEWRIGKSTEERGCPDEKNRDWVIINDDPGATPPRDGWKYLTDSGWTGYWKHDPLLSVTGARAEDLQEFAECY